MEELKELLNEIMNDMERKLDEETYESAIKAVKQAKSTIIVATDNSIGMTGSREKILSTWCVLTTRLMNELDAIDIMDKAFEVCKEISSLPEEEQSKTLAKKALEATKNTVERMKEEKSFADRLEEIDKELQELQKEAE